MSKVADYLREHVVGEVSTNSSVRKHFSTDASIFEVTPQVVVYPRTTDDVRKIARFSWQLAQRGKAVPITARGAGSDQSGAAIGEGIVLVFPTHMNKLLELDTKRNYARVQPGINYRNFQDTIKTHGRFLPPFPSSIDYSTLGGAIANNSVGERSVKYGSTRDFVTGLKVVLANGELIETGRLSKRDLNRKKGLSTFEGEIYRQLDGLLSDNGELIQSTSLTVRKNSAGYALAEVKRPDGSFDLTPLFVGSQGTLGIITEADIQVAPNNMERTLLVAGLSDLNAVNTILPGIMKLEPAALEMVDKTLLEFIDVHYPNQLKGLIEPPFPAVLLLIEFDDLGRGVQTRKSKKLIKLIKKVTEDFQVTTNYDERDELWKIRHAAASIISHTEDGKDALPIIEDGIVPSEKFEEFIAAIYQMFAQHGLSPAVWGRAGNANVHVQPLLDLSKVGDRQKVFKIMDEYYEMVINLGGSTAAGHNDGRLRTSYLPKLFGEEIYKIFMATKKIFDPHAILNPGVKTDFDRTQQLKVIRHAYDISRFSQHLPRT